MFQEVFNSIKQSISGPCPGKIDGIIGLEESTLPAIDSISGSFTPIMNIGIARFGMPVPVVSPLIGYKFKGTESDSQLSRIISPETYQKVITHLEAQKEIFGQVQDLPAELGGSGYSVSIPLPDVDSMTDW